MSTLENTKSKVNGGRAEFLDGLTHERVLICAPVQWEDDFCGAGWLTVPAAGSAANGYPWVKKIVGAGPPTVAGVANAAEGQIANTLTATSEKQDGVLYFGDQLNFDATKGLIYETRAALTVLPSAASVQAVWGLAGPWIDGPDNNTFYLEFGATANGEILLRSQDGVTQSSVDSGIAVVAAAFHLFRIDATNVNDVRFYIDGVDVTGAAGTIKFAATGTSAILQPYHAVYKPSGVGVGTLTSDVIKVWANRS